MSASINRSIVRSLGADAKWARSIPPIYKRHLQQLVDHGYVERIAPPNGRARNMLRLTEKGRAVLAEIQ
jgi:DNA-binding MarR family transcriptional regulator